MQQVPRAAIALAAASISACAAQLEEVRIDVSADGAGTFEARGSGGPTSGGSATMADLRPGLQALRDELERCGMRTTQREEPDRFHLEANFAFSGPGEFRDTILCRNGFWTDAVVDVERDEGLFTTSYVTTVRLTAPLLRARSGAFGTGISSSSLDWIPRTFVLSVPGTVDDFRFIDGIAGMEFSHRSGSANSVSIFARENQAELNRRREIERSARRTIATDRAAIDDMVARHADRYELRVESSAFTMRPIAFVLPLLLLLAVGIAVLRRRASQG